MSLKIPNQNEGKRIQKLTISHAVPCHGGSHLGRSHDQEDEEEGTCDTVTKGQWNPKRGRERLKGKQMISLYN